MRLKLTTLNLQAFTNWESRHGAIVNYLKQTDADLVLFQEVVYLPGISALNQVQLLNQELQYPYIQSAVTRLQPSPQYETYREGLALLSKHPVLAADTIVLKQASGDEHNRIVQLVDVKIEGEIIKIANVHFSLTEVVDYGTAHLKETLDILASRNEARIIGGDFNLAHLEAMEELWGEQYRLSTEEEYISFPADQKRIDYFLIPRAYSFEDIITSDDTLSDHRAVTVDIMTN